MPHALCPARHCAVAAAMAYARRWGRRGRHRHLRTWSYADHHCATRGGARSSAARIRREAPLKSGWYTRARPGPLITATGAVSPVAHANECPSRYATHSSARRERRPVVIGVPFDCRGVRGTADGPAKTLARAVAAPSDSVSSDDVAAAAKLLAGTERVVVLAGLRCGRSRRGCRLPRVGRGPEDSLATTLPARGLFHDDPSASASRAASRRRSGLNT